MSMNYLRRNWKVEKIDVDVYAILDEDGNEIASCIADEGIVRLMAASPTLFDTLKNIADNYDHDEDGHRYRTGCRCCKARDAIEGIFSEDSQP